MKQNESNRIYLDWASSAPLLAQVAEIMQKAQTDLFGNPSSIHSEGRAAREKLEQARITLAQAADCFPEELVFTSGATEANTLVFDSLAGKTLLHPGHRKRPRIIASAIEHSSVWEPLAALRLMGFDVRIVLPEKSGIILPEKIAAQLSDDTALVCLMLVNNETGAIQPVGECARLVHDFCLKTGRKIHVHSDAVQAFGKIMFSFKHLGVDSASINAHKLGGPRGAGALLVKKKSGFEALFPGGGQEQNRRSGTENLAVVCGFAEAARLRLESFESNQQHIRRLVDLFLAGCRRIEGLHIVRREGADYPEGLFSPYILSVCIPPVPGEVLVRSLDDQGFAVSSGSACHAGKKDATRVLEAQGLTKQMAKSALRISVGPETTQHDITALLGALEETVPLLRRITGKSG